MNDTFLKISEHEELAQFFGLTYSQLAQIIYATDDPFKYRQFEIPKKNGGQRTISAPSRKLKAVQIRLKDALYEIYPGRPAAHGFAKKKSIVTNAGQHLDKRFVFNLDLSDFFGSIFFARIKNLFKSKPFRFSDPVSAILAQICCFQNRLPQGAPTSPILSNMIAWKLDSQLQHLAKTCNCTYTRYADDITFSFTCTKNRLPRNVVVIHNDTGIPGTTLEQIIRENGFEINYDKVRLCSTTSRMEVTGLTVNQNPNVRRQYVRQISSMIHAWRKFGYERASFEYNNKYSSAPHKKHLLNVIKGKLAFLRSVRGYRDKLFIKLAKQFNELAGTNNGFLIVEPTNPEKAAIAALWVIEVCYDNDEEDVAVSQGSGVQVEGVGIVTCAHVVSKDQRVYKHIHAYKWDDVVTQYELRVERVCQHRDLAICAALAVGENAPPPYAIGVSPTTVKIQDRVQMLGFPAHGPGHSYSLVDTEVTKVFPQSCVAKFEIGHQVREGNSGGPIINTSSQVVGIVVEGASKGSGNNGCVSIEEIKAVIELDEHKIIAS